MNKTKWTMKWITNSDKSLTLNIIDNQNRDSVFEKWTACNEGELIKHLDELKASIDFGTYTDLNFGFNNVSIKSWAEFSQKSRNYFHEMMTRKAA